MLTKLWETSFGLIKHQCMVNISETSIEPLLRSMEERSTLEVSQKYNGSDCEKHPNSRNRDNENQ